MAEYTYRATVVTTHDYGDGAGSSGKVATATLAVLPDGSHWQDRPATISTRVPLGTRPGDEWRVVIELKPAKKGNP